MRALAGPAMLLVMIGGYGLHRALSKPEGPPLKFTNLELAGAEAQGPGSCFALSTVLIANRRYDDAVRTWTSPRDGAWTLLLENIDNRGRGPVKVFQSYTFEQHGDLVKLVAVEASEDRSTALAATLDRLLEAPNDLRSTPVDRCLAKGAEGYRFKPQPQRQK